MNTVWVVGDVFEDEYKRGSKFKLIGIYSSEEKAITACNEGNFYGPINIDDVESFAEFNEWICQICPSCSSALYGKYKFKQYASFECHYDSSFINWEG